MASHSPKTRANIFAKIALSTLHPNQYRRRAFKYHGKKCWDCGYDTQPEILHVHHIDGNRRNNAVGNLVPLCPNCHALRHFKEKQMRRFVSPGSPGAAPRTQGVPAQSINRGPHSQSPMESITPPGGVTTKDEGAWTKGNGGPSTPNDSDWTGGGGNSGPHKAPPVQSTPDAPKTNFNIEGTGQ